MGTLAEIDRLELYRLFADAGRLQLFALAAEEELSLGELAEVLSGSQSQISRRASPLRQAGLLDSRREGTRSYVSMVPGVDSDPVVRDALDEGRRLCEEDGAFARVAQAIARREAHGEAYFEQAPSASPATLQSPDLLAHAVALRHLMPGRELAIDVGCGDGASIELLAPLYQRVIALDRSAAQLAVAANRVGARGLTNVSLMHGRYDQIELVQRADRAGGADLVLCARVLHHASRPAHAVQAFTRLLRPGGHLALLDYAPHHDESLRAHGDVWLGFSREELTSMLEQAGLRVVACDSVPNAFIPAAADRHLRWQTILGRKP